MFDQLLTAKITLPAPADNLIVRPRLLERLEQLPQRRLTLITAPAGSGKTTLIQQWLAESPIPAAWFSIDENDNDPQRFLTYLIGALQTVNSELGQTTLALLQAPQVLPLDKLITPLVNDINSLVASCVLVLDDYHFIQNLNIHNALLFLIEHAPPSLNLIILSREDPPIPVQRLRAGSQLLEIRDADLRFISEEVRQFFSQTMSLKLDFQTTITLQNRTEGWAAGLRMAALSLKSETDIPGFVKSFAGDHRYVADYLIAEVLERQSDQIRDFLLASSIPDRFTPALCDELVEASGQPAHAIIDQIERMGLFLIPLDHTRQWYRYHRLFADLLRYRLKRADSQKYKELNRKAGHWFLQEGHLDEAIQHGLAGGDFSWVGDVLENTGIRMVGRSQLGKLRQWIHSLPHTEVKQRPYLSILLAWIESLSGDRRLAAEHLMAAEADTQRAPDKLQPAIKSHVALLKAYGARSRGDLDLSLNLAQEALRFKPDHDLFLECTIHLNMGGNHWLQGNLRAAELALQRAVSYQGIPEIEYPSLAAAGFLANTYFQQGRLMDAETLCKNVLAHTRTPPHPATAYIYLEQGELLYEYNRLEQALSCLTSAINLGELTDRVVNVVRARLIAAQIHSLLGQEQESVDLLEEASNVYRQSGPRYELMHQIEYDYYHLRCLLRLGNLSVAMKWAAEYQFSEERSTPWLCLNDLIYARILLRDGQIDSAVNTLNSCEEAAREAGAMGWVIEAQAIRALCFQAGSKPNQSLDELCKALTHAEPEGYTRTFIDLGEPMSDLLARLLTHKSDYGHYHVSHDYVSRLLRSIQLEKQFSAPLVEPLTKRELEVLGLLSAGLTNREIADRLVITIGTVKQYNHSIFRKLEVSTRQEAADRARALHLL